MWDNQQLTYGRAAIVLVVLALAVAPTVPLLLTIASDDSARPLWTRSFLIAVRNSLLVASGVVTISLVFWRENSGPEFDAERNTIASDANR